MKSQPSTFADQWAKFKDRSKRDADREAASGRRQKRKQPSSGRSAGGASVSLGNVAGGDEISSMVDAVKKQQVVKARSGKTTSSFANQNDRIARVKELMDQRQAAREADNWLLSDQLRLELKEIGVHIQDQKDGPSGWRFGDGSSKKPTQATIISKAARAAISKAAAASKKRPREDVKPVVVSVAAEDGAKSKKKKKSKKKVKYVTDWDNN